MFITEKIRKQAGQSSKVSDNAMLQMNVERKGICQVCGHKIKHHYGVHIPDMGYMWVGNKCYHTLTNENSDTIIATGKFEKNGYVMVALTDEEYNNLVTRAFKSGITHVGSGLYQENARRYILNRFLASLVKYADNNRDRALTQKQYQAAFKQRVIK